MQDLLVKSTLTNDSNANDLAVEIWIDDKKFFDNCISKGKHHVVFPISDEESCRQLKFVFKNKTEKHTTISQSGHIVSDCTIEVTDIMFDNINIDQIFSEHAIYKHNFNCTSDPIETKFYGVLGCNGEVVFNFSTPFYLWFLENM